MYNKSDIEERKKSNGRYRKWRSSGKWKVEVINVKLTEEEEEEEAAITFKNTKATESERVKERERAREAASEGRPGRRLGEAR